MTPNLPLVVLTQIPMNQDRIRSMVRVSRLVAQWNGNRTGRCPVNIITDDFQLARDALVQADASYAKKKAAVLRKKNAGLFWPDSGVMWIRPNEFRVGQNIRSLTHEMAHAIVPGEHPCTWRRMYGMLLPLWWKAFRPYDDFGLNIRFEIAHITRVYTGTRMSADRQREEVDTHVIAANRAYHRWAHLL